MLHHSRPKILSDHGLGDAALELCRRGVPFTLARVRLTEFWDRMRKQFGDGYAESVAKDYVLSGLGSRTVDQALADGEDAKTVWRAVCEAFRVPERLR
jgi:hypothetical protein